jgi:hypothetical protein
MATNWAKCCGSVQHETFVLVDQQQQQQTNNAYEDKFERKRPVFAGTSIGLEDSSEWSASVLASVASRV